MHDIEFIRNRPNDFDVAMRKRGIKPIAQKILHLDTVKRSLISRNQKLKEEKNLLIKEISLIKSQNGNYKELSEKSKTIARQIKNAEIADDADELYNLLSSLPNIPANEVPLGPSNANIEIRKHKEPVKFSFTPKPHYDLGIMLGEMNFKDAAKISGSRFTMITGMLAKLERALINFMLDLHTEKFGYTEISHPYLVREQAMFGVGQLPKFDQESFKITNGLRLIPTSEVFLTNIVSNSILEKKDLPLRFTANAACFRAEAGSAGRDTRGIMRQHQFNKVELVSITLPSNGRIELDRITGIAEEILKLLDIPYRVMMLSTEDMGFSACITYDIEVWIPSQNIYREISSCSYCSDFQARRMKARYKEDNKISFVHTLNGSALAIGRTIAAIMENYQNDDGSIRIPKILQPYLGGKEVISSQRIV